MNPMRAVNLKRQQMRQYESRPASKLTSITAPVGGINTRDALDAMPATDATVMSNWFPNKGSVNVRLGTAQRYVGIGTGDVLTIAEYFSGTNRKLLAASQTNIYDAAKQPSYSVNAVDNNGAAYLTKSSALAGASDGKSGAISLWFRIDGTGATGVTFSIQNSGSDRFVIGIANGGQITVSGWNASGTKIMDFKSFSTYSVSTTWHNLLIAWDLAAGTKYIYVDGASDLGTVTTFTNDSIEYSANGIGILAKSGGTVISDISISEIYINLSTSIDFSSSTNRQKFRDTNGFPVSLGTDGSTPTGTAPVIYLNGTYLAFGTNSGSGGNFIVNGTLSASSTSPTSTALSLLGSQTSGRWQTCNFMTNMLWVNGQDTPQVFGGSTFTSWTGSCSGMTASSVIGCNVYRNRIYVWMANDSNFFYSATSTIGGTYTKFPLGDVANHGGDIVSIKTLSHDGGNGPTDYLAIFMSSGDTIVYSGDPASTFTLVGIYRIPPPMGIRSVIKFGGDILIQARNDYILFSQVVSGIYKNPTKISGALQDAVTNYASNNGWQLLYWPEGGIIFGNIPISATEFQQHVLNTLENTWTVYDDINARCWGVYNGNIYFGAGDGSIYQAETGYSDNGSDIVTDIQQAWNDVGYVSRKQVQSYRPVMTAIGTLTYDSGIAYDYGAVNVTSTSSQASEGAAWDASDWDTTSWSPEVQLKQSWNGANGIGYKVGLRLRTQSSGQAINWYRTDFLSVPAGPI